MKNGIQIFARVEGGEVIIPPETLGRFWKAVGGQFEGKRIVIEAKKNTTKRSLDQNAYYWGVVVSMIRVAVLELGNVMTAAQVHEMLKAEFSEKETLVSFATGKILELPKSTTAYSKDDFFDTYIDKIRNWAANFLCLQIPDPGEPHPIPEIEFKN